jgi:hypothetical protein
MPEKSYIVETTENFSNDALEEKLNDIVARGYLIFQIIDKPPDTSDNGYTVIGFKPVMQMHVEPR